jgi:hypothetical protein
VRAAGSPKTPESGKTRDDTSFAAVKSTNNIPHRLDGDKFVYNVDRSIGRRYDAHRSIAAPQQTVQDGIRLSPNVAHAAPERTIAPIRASVSCAQTTYNCLGLLTDVAARLRRCQARRMPRAALRMLDSDRAHARRMRVRESAGREAELTDQIS